MPEQTQIVVEGLPPTLLFLDGAGVLRDEGRPSSAEPLRAGRAIAAHNTDGTVHDFLPHNTQRNPARAAIDPATAFLPAAHDTE